MTKLPTDAGSLASQSKSVENNQEELGAMSKLISAMQRKTRLAIAVALTGAAVIGPLGYASAQEPIKLGVVAFLSGPASEPMGIPGRNGAELVIDAINSGELPAPYSSKGLGGRQIEPEYVDEAGGNSRQVEEFRSLVRRRGADAVVGYISSGSCGAVAPVAENLKTLTVFATCGAVSLFENGEYDYVFRTIAHVASDNIAAALYLRDNMPGLKSYTGINQNYAFGQENWLVFHAAMESIMPHAKLAGTPLWPKLFAGQFGADISALMLGDAELIYSSFWDGDLEAFVLQSNVRGLADRKKLLFSIGANSVYSLGRQMPDGVIIGAHGPYGILAADVDTPLNRWFIKAYSERYGKLPVETSYQYAQTIVALKAAADKAMASGEDGLTLDQIRAALKGLEFESLSTTVRMTLGNGHQAVHENGYGVIRWNEEKGEAAVVDRQFYPVECVMPPQEMKSLEWIKAGMQGSSCIK
jgi:branched-chain amino acid transport system substrate-binding protein